MNIIRFTYVILHLLFIYFTSFFSSCALFSCTKLIHFNPFHNFQLHLKMIFQQLLQIFLYVLLHFYMFQTLKSTAIFIKFYNLRSFKGKRKQIIFYRVYYIDLSYHFLFSSFFTLGIQSTIWYHFLTQSFNPTYLLCAVFVKYITFLYVKTSTIQLCTYCFM